MPVIIGSGIDITNPPDPPLDYLIHEDFENGALQPQWNAAWGDLNIDTWANFGIPAPPSGQALGRKILPGTGLDGDIPAVYHLWVTLREFMPTGRSSWERKIQGYYDSVEMFQIQFTTAGKFAIRSQVYSDDWQISPTVFPDDSWVACKAFINVHETEGDIQLWVWVSGAWQLDVDLQDIPTKDSTHLSINRVRGPSIAVDAHYCDEVNFLKLDPGAEMR